MISKVSDLPEWGSFALVTYIPEPLGSFLYSLRHSLPGDDKPQAHITVLPPRPLKADVDSVSRQARIKLSRFAPFVVELSGIKAFPITNILYLEIAGGRSTLHELHDALNTGLLAHEESFDFLPHLTISGPVPLKSLAKLRAQAKRVWREPFGETKFEVNEIVALWQPLHGSPEDWNRLWSQKLGDGGSSARAGSMR
jgi:2'-5' RNA ligase